MNKADTRTLLETSVVKQVKSLNWIFLIDFFFKKYTFSSVKKVL